MYAKNQIKINSGKITLYQREDVADGIWHCRFKIKGHKGYIRRSTGQIDRELANDSAIAHCAEAEFRQKNDIPIKRQTFTQLAMGYLKVVEREFREKQKSEGRYTLIKGTLDRYLIPYWGKRDVTQLSKQDIATYLEWRKDYWITGPGKDRKDVGRKLVPQPNTLKQEWTVFRGVIQHGVDMGGMSPNTMHLLKHRPARGTRRPAFTEEELNKLEQHMDVWIEATEHPRVKRDRELLRDYVMILAYSGIRVGEARNLRWRDVKTYTKNNKSWPLLHVDGKTGERDAIAQPQTSTYLERMKLRGYCTAPDDLVFTHLDGEPIKVMTGFTPLLKDAGLLCDGKQRKRTRYSLRHTYASIRLENNCDVYWLTKNMGTSVAMIEKHYGQSNGLKSIESNTAIRNQGLSSPAGRSA
jgi:integrase